MKQLFSRTFKMCIPPKYWNTMKTLIHTFHPFFLEQEIDNKKDLWDEDLHGRMASGIWEVYIGNMPNITYLIGHKFSFTQGVSYKFSVEDSPHSIERQFAIEMTKRRFFQWETKKVYLPLNKLSSLIVLFYYITLIGVNNQGVTSCSKRFIDDEIFLREFVEKMDSDLKVLIY